MVQHLQKQLALREAELEQMVSLKKHETELKAEVEKLGEKLREAKRTQTPVRKTIFNFKIICFFEFCDNLLKIKSGIFFSLFHGYYLIYCFYLSH